MGQGRSPRRAPFPRPARTGAGGPASPRAPSGPRAAAPEAAGVLVGEFGRPHGLKGELRLKSYTADPLAIGSYGPLATEAGRTLSLVSVRPAPGAAPDLLIARVEGVATRDAAEALNRTRLHVDRGRLPPPEDADEFLVADLVGLTVETPAGETLGTVAAVPNYGGGDLLEIAPAGGGATALLPFTRAFVPGVDLAAGRIVADAPADLFEPARPEPRESPEPPTPGPGEAG
jgi:16S rRNA processing protein RimM